MGLSPTCIFCCSGNPFTCPQSSFGQGQHLEDYSDDFIGTMILKELAVGHWISEWWCQSMLLSWDIWKCPSFPCQNQRRGGMIENNIDTLDSLLLCLPINMQMCLPRNCWRGYGHSLASLPILIWQVKSGPSGGPAPVIEKLGLDQGLYWCCRLAILRIAQVISKAVVIVKVGK